MSCDDDGRFMTTQCNDESCYCVDADTGDVTSAKISTSDEFNLNCSSLMILILFYRHFYKYNNFSNVLYFNVFL